jgi:hypothetical protein
MPTSMPISTSPVIGSLPVPIADLPATISPATAAQKTVELDAFAPPGYACGYA